MEIKHSDTKLILTQDKSHADPKCSEVQEGKDHFLLGSSGKAFQAKGLCSVQEVPG